MATDPKALEALPVRGARLRIALYYSAMFGMVGVFMPFFPVWLESRGLSAAEIGVALATIMWVRVFTNPVLTQFADRLPRRKPLVVGLSIAGTISACLFFGVEGFWPVLLVAMLHTVLQAPVNPLGENLVLLNLRARGLDYGRLRSWGSLAFIVTSLGAGAWFEGRSPDWVIALFVVGLALVVASLVAMPDVRAPSTAGLRAPIRRLLVRRDFQILIVCVGFNMASHAVLNGFATLHWQAAGHGKDVIGGLWAVGVISEIALFAFSRQLIDRIGIPGILAMGAVAGIVRWIGLGSTTELWALVPFQMLHGLTFGATHLGGMHFIQRLIPPDASATAQGLYSSIAMGGFVGITMLFTGSLYGALGGAAFWVMAGFSTASLAMAGLVLKVSNQSSRTSVSP